MLGLLCVLSGCSGGDNADSPEGAANGGGQASQQHAASGDRTTPAEASTEEEAVVAAVNDAIRMLEEKRYREFIEAYVPVDELRRMRETNEIDDTIADIEASPEKVEQLLAMLRQAQGLTPQFNAFKTEATFGVETPEPAAEPAVVAAIESSAGQAPPSGYGGDLSAVLDQAIAALETGDVTAFVERMFPPAELARLRVLDQLTTEIERLKAAPEMIQGMLADLRTLKSLTPEYQDSGNVAAYTIQRGTVEFGGRQTELAPREIRLQKTAGHWRLYDHSRAAHLEILRQSKLAVPDSTFEVTLKLERIGDDWRLAPKPGGARSSRRRPNGARPEAARPVPRQPVRPIPSEADAVPDPEPTPTFDPLRP